MKNKFLKVMAEKFETSDFLKGDPSFFLHRFKNRKDTEILGLFAASLSLGQRKQFMPLIERVACEMGKSAVKWVKNDEHKRYFSNPNKVFYRFYKEKDVCQFFDVVKGIILSDGSIGSFCKKNYQSGVHPLTSLIKAFKGCPLVPQSETSSCKRLNLYLRWMVRDNSPIDLGLWKWFPKKDLIIPLDVHVLRVSRDLGLIKTYCASLKTAKEITRQLSAIWPEDPCKGDFALFGYGVLGGNRNPIDSFAVGVV